MGKRDPLSAVSQAAARSRIPAPKSPVQYDYWVETVTKQNMQSQLDQMGERGYSLKYVNWLGTNNYLVVMEAERTAND